MAISARHFTTNGKLRADSGSDGISYTTASIAPVAGRLVLIGIYSRTAALVPFAAPIVTGCGETWTQNGTRREDPNGRNCLRVYGMIANGTSGAVTIDFNFDGASPTYKQDWCNWTVVEYANIDASSAIPAAYPYGEANVTDFWVGVESGSSTNATVAMVAGRDSISVTPYPGFTKQGEVTAAFRGMMATEWKNSFSFGQVGVTFASTQSYALIKAFEIQAAVSATATPAALSRSFVLPQPGVSGAIIATPASLTLGLSLPTPNATAEENPTPDPITFTHLTTDGTTTDFPAFTTGTITPTDDALVLIAIFSKTKPFVPVAAPVVAGCGLTFNQIDKRIADDTDRYHLRVYRAMGNAEEGEITIDFTASGLQEFCWWSVCEFGGGVNRTGVNGSGAYAQTLATNVSEFTSGQAVFLDAFESIGSATYGAFATSNFRTFTAGPGTNGPAFTLIGQDGALFQGAIATEYKLLPDQGVNILFDDPAINVLGRALEIRQESGPAGVDADALPDPLTLGLTILLPGAASAAVAEPDVLAFMFQIGVPLAGIGFAAALPTRFDLSVSFPVATQIFFAPLGIGVTFPELSFVSISTIEVDPLEMQVLFLDANAGTWAAPEPLTMMMDFAPFTTVTIRPTFSPPATDVVPPVEVDTPQPARRFYQRYELMPRARNIYLMKDGTLTEDDPYTTYGEDGQVAEEAWSRVEKVWWGAHIPTPVTDDEAALLEAAGYSLLNDVEVS